MSLINKMLQDLDRRQAQPAAGDERPPQEVRAVFEARARERWVVRGVIATLIAASVGWMAWVAYQVQFRPLATQMAMRVARSRPQVASSPISEQRAPAVPALAPPSVPTSPRPAAPQASASTTPAAPPAASAAPETFKLATRIAQPDRELPAEASLRREKLGSPSGRQHEPTRATAGNARAVDAAAGAVESAPEAAPPRVEKSAYQDSADQRAQERFHRAIGLLNEGRVSEAEDSLLTALQAEPSYQPARQALVALLLDQRRIDDAQRVLQDGLALDPKQTQFATVLARILAGRGDYAGALAVLDRAGPLAQRDADFDLLLGGVLQRLSEHAKAVEAYRAAVHAAPDNGKAWVGLGISLEALQKRTEALDAYRRAMATTSLTAAVRSYAEQRVQQLQ